MNLPNEIEHLSVEDLVPYIMVQLQTQSNSGGNTEAYKTMGTYVKSFYSVMAAPSCCKVSILGTTHPRIHHKIDWNKAVPKILHERFKKTSTAR